MAARRLVAVLIVMLVLSTVAALLVPAPKRNTQDSSSSTTSRATTTTSSTTAAKRSPGDIIHARIDADAKGKPKPAEVRLSVGDELRLRVLARSPDQVELRGFGQIEAVGPSGPALFDVFADRPGRFDVVMVDADRTVGQVVVRQRRHAQG